MTTFIEKAPELCIEMLVPFLAGSIYGQCYHFAIALHRGLGWPIAGLLENKKIIHAGVKSPEGKIWDGRGEVSKEDFAKPFSKSSRVIREVTEEELRSTGTIKDCMVGSYLEKAQIVWPDLPWNQPTYQERVIAFVDELEALSRKYRLWICSPVFTNPEMFPVIFEGNDDEAGYNIRMNVGGRSYTINRVIK